MLNYEEAKALAYEFINEKYNLGSEDEIVILEDGSGEAPDVWIFQYNSRKYIETGNSLFIMQVEHPIVVSKADGTCQLKKQRPTIHGF